MDSKVEDYKSLLLQQRGAGSIEVYRGSYRSQYGAGFGDVLRSIWRIAFPVLLRGAKTLITTGAEALKESDATPGSVFKAVLKPTVASLVDQTGQELAKVLSPTSPQTQTYHAPPPPQLFEPSSQVGTESSPEASGRFGGVALAQSASRAPARLIQTGGSRRKRFSPYNVSSRHYSSIPNKHFKHYNF